MTKTLNRVGIASIALFAVTVSQAANETAIARKAITARYEAQHQAVLQKNVKFLETYLSKDYVSYRENGLKMKREDAINGFEILIDTVQVTSWQRKISSFKLIKSTATVKSSVTVQGIVELSKKERAKIIATQVVEDTWVKTKKTWMLHSSKVLKASQKFEEIKDKKSGK